METISHPLLGSLLIYVRAFPTYTDCANIARQSLFHIRDVPPTGSGFYINALTAVRAVDHLGDILGGHINVSVRFSIYTPNRAHVSSQAGRCSQYWNDASADPWCCFDGDKHCSQASRLYISYVRPYLMFTIGLVPTGPVSTI